MKTSWIVGIVLVIIIILGGWYFMSQQQSATTDTTGTNPSDTTGASGDMGSSGQTTSTTNSTTTTTTVTPANVVLNTGMSAKLGTYLTAANGMTLYHYTKDIANKSNCTGTCAANWSPYTVASVANLSAITGITGAVDTITRADGSLQVTYKGMPLYFYKNDANVGDTTGQSVGGVWFVVKP